MRYRWNFENVWKKEVIGDLKRFKIGKIIITLASYLFKKILLLKGASKLCPELKRKKNNLKVYARSYSITDITYNSTELFLLKQILISEKCTLFLKIERPPHLSFFFFFCPGKYRFLFCHTIMRKKASPQMPLLKRMAPERRPILSIFNGSII